MNKEKLIERWKDKTKVLGFSPEYVAFWRYIDDLVDNQKRYLNEIERLNNIINELEKEISRHIALCTDVTLNDILDKLKELKENNKNDNS